MAHVVCNPCGKCQKERLQAACVLVCPVDCLYTDGRTMFIHPGQCTDCTLCVPACPEHAIFHEDTVPDEWQEDTWTNYFTCATHTDLTRCRRPAPPAI